jgi:CheY-like chemotaxis protein
MLRPGKCPGEEQQGPEEQSGAPLPPRRSVLLVEDNLDSARTLALLLRTRGHEVRVVHDGAAALQAVQESKADVVLLDIGLPGMNGYEVARALKALPLPSPPLLVALTGYGLPEDRQQALEAGFDEHLVKPVALEALEHLLRSAAGDSRRP